MEPLKPENKQAILSSRPQASPADIEEYERLLAARFAQNPLPAAPQAAPRAGPLAANSSQAREARLAELHARLFGGD